MPAKVEKAVEPTVPVAVYEATITPRDRMALVALLHVVPDLQTAELTLVEWDARMVDFLQSTPE